MFWYKSLLIRAYLLPKKIFLMSFLFIIKQLKMIKKKLKFLVFQLDFEKGHDRLESLSLGESHGQERI